MSSETGLHVVLGAGPLGGAVLRHLRSLGEPVRAVTRSGHARELPDVETKAADLASPGAAAEACRGAAVLYHCAGAPYSRWTELLPPMLEGAIHAARETGATLVYGDNLYMYGPVRQPITEDLPYAATGKKGRLRASLAQRLLDAHESGNVRAVIGRASDFFGPDVRTSFLGEQVFEPALEGKPARVIGDPDQPHTYTFIDDFARALVRLGREPEALGSAWHVPSAPTVSTREFVRLVFAEAGRPMRLRAAPPWLVRTLALFGGTMREIKEMLYEFEAPHVVDHGRYAARFGADPTPHREAIARTLDWYRRHPKSG